MTVPTIQSEFRNIDPIRDYMGTVKRGYTRDALRAIGMWMIGTPQRGLKHYQPYKYVSREKGYSGQKITIDYGPHKGKVVTGYFSSKQYYFVILGGRGKIDPGVPHRTGNTQRGWHLVEGNNGYKPSIVNATPGATYTRHDTLQSKLNALAGWRKVSEVISTNIHGAIRHAQAAINELIRKGNG